jgi:hypothetical protein
MKGMKAGRSGAKVATVLPSFFVVGAQKAGTSSLHQRLCEYPAIRLPLLKETHFFSSDDQFARGVDWYLRQFPEIVSDSIVGEVAPDYLFSPAAPGRIKALIPRPRLIFIFREPLQRAYSHYLMSVRNGYENLPFALALRMEPDRMNCGQGRKFLSYFSRSLYVEQLQRYLELFPREDMLFLKFEDLVDQGETGLATFLKIAEFLGLRVEPGRERELVRANPASQPRSLLLRNLLYGRSPVKKFVRLLLPSRDLRAAIAHRLDLLNLKPVAKGAMGAIPGEICARARKEIEGLQKLTGMMLDDWLEQLSQYERT